MALQPDLVVVSGDLTQRGRTLEFEQAREFLDSIPLPRLVVPGNHDVQGTWKFWERFLTPFQNYRRIVDTDLEPVFRTERMVAAGANSARPVGWNLDWSRGRLSRQQMGRIMCLYERADQDSLRVLVVHHPPAAPPRGTPRHLLGGLREFTGAVNQAGVDLVLSGHFHMSYAQALALPGGRTSRSCVLSSVSTATSHRLKGEPNGFHYIDGDAHRLTIQDWAWTGGSYAAKRLWIFESDPSTRDWRLLAAES